MLVQAICNAAEASKAPLATFSPAVLRHALRCAGNIVYAHEVEQVLSYVISDQQYRDLHNLYLICLSGDSSSIQQIKVPSTAANVRSKMFFIAGTEQNIYEMMSFGEQLQVAPSQSWDKLLK